MVTILDRVLHKELLLIDHRLIFQNGTCLIGGKSFQMEVSRPSISDLLDIIRLYNVDVSLNENITLLIYVERNEYGSPQVTYFCDTSYVGLCLNKNRDQHATRYTYKDYWLHYYNAEVIGFIFSLTSAWLIQDS